PRSLDDLAAETEQVNRLRMQAGYVELGALLPALISELVVHAHQVREPERSRAFRLLADAYTAVDSMAYKLGYLDLFALAVERMSWAAAQSDDPLLKPVAAMRRSSVFLATGAWDGGMSLLARASREMNGAAKGDAGLSIAGTIRLRASILAARGAMPGPAWENIGLAEEVAWRLGHDTRDYGLLFGPTNVAIHGVAVAVEPRDADEAGRRRAEMARA